MTIEQIAEKLNNCAICKSCIDCQYELLKNKEFTCRKLLIKEMADECKRIVSESEDDFK